MDASTQILDLTVNGEPRAFSTRMTVAALVIALELDIRKVAVELNREIVPRSTYAQVALNSGDTLEIVHFIGGG
jgi:thiamine biosynthesis protein ThiS